MRVDEMKIKIVNSQLIFSLLLTNTEPKKMLIILQNWNFEMVLNDN